MMADKTKRVARIRFAFWGQQSHSGAHFGHRISGTAHFAHFGDSILKSPFLEQGRKCQCGGIDSARQSAAECTYTVSRTPRFRPENAPHPVADVD